MKRLVGLPKNRKGSSPSSSQTKPSIDDVVKAADRRTETLELKIADCDNQLRLLNQQIKRADSEAAKLSLKQRARPILQRKKHLEQQADISRDKSFNLDTIASSLNSAEDAKIVVGCLKQTTKVLKKDLKKLDVDKIEDVQDELNDLIELTEDVNSSLSKSYDVPPDLDDDELTAALDMLGDEIIRDNDPSYIDAVINSSIGGVAPQAPPADGQMQMVDEFGLPVLGNINTNQMGTEGGNNNSESASVSHNP